MGHGGKLMEGTDDIVERFKIIEVILVDIQNNGDIRRETQEGIRKFAGLTDQCVAVADAAVAVD